MKKTILLYTLALCSSHSIGQKLHELRKDYPASYPRTDTIKRCLQFEEIVKDKNGKKLRNGKINLLTPEAFDQFIIDKYTYAILGTASPTTGFKVETVNPSISLKGNIMPFRRKTTILPFELTAGTKDGIMDVFSKSKLNTYFKASVGISFLPCGNSAKFISSYQSLCNIRLQAAQTYEQLLRAQDTMIVLQALIDTAMLRQSGKVALFATKYISVTKAVPDSVKLDSLKSIATHLLAEYGVKGAFSQALLDSFAKSWDNPTDLQKEKQVLLKQEKRLRLMEGKFVDSLNRYEINAAKDLWTSHNLTWITISPFINNSNFGLYDSMNKVIDQKSSFLVGVKGVYNWLIKYKEPHRYFYLAGGVTLQKTNSLTDDDMTKFAYKKTEEIKVTDPGNGNISEKLSTEEPGTAYRGNFKEGFGWEAFCDAYWVPWKVNFIPGFYGQVKFSHADFWYNKNKLSLTTGLVFNVTSSDKDAKNLLTVIPYVKWSNVLKIEKDPAMGKEVDLKDLFSVGLTVGIPINIGK